jgi:hypothetical protein
LPILPDSPVVPVLTEPIKQETEARALSFHTTVSGVSGWMLQKHGESWTTQSCEGVPRSTGKLTAGNPEKTHGRGLVDEPFLAKPDLVRF